MNKFIFSRKYNLIGSMSIIMGLIYFLGLYAPTENEVNAWGLVSIILGICFLIVERNKYIFLKILLSLLILAMQPLPIYLWFDFHGRGISDPAPGSKFVAHWVFSIPHIIILILCGISIIQSFISIIKNNRR